MKGWTTEKIGSLCDAGGGKVKTGPFGSQLHEFDYSETGIPVVMPQDILDGRIDETHIARVSEAHVERLHKHKLSKGDIIYGRRGDIGRQALIRNENIGWLCGTGCLRITLGKSSVIPGFLHRYLQMPEIIDWVEGQAIGATMPNLNTNILRRVPITYPKNKETQRKIAAILSAYDELIENNKQLIAQLERLAEEIYREWFVRLRFPGHERLKVVKGIPAGWSFDKASTFFGLVKGKSYAGDEITDNPDHMPFISLKSFNRGGGYREDGLKYYSGRYKDKQVVRQNDVVVALTDMTQDRAVVGRPARIPNLGERGAVISLDAVKLVPHNINSTFLYAYMRHSGISESIKEFANGTNVLHLKPELITNQRTIIPPRNLQDDFASKASLLYAQVDFLGETNKRLIMMRGRLLPRLISGKLSVEKCDIQFPPGMAEELSAEPTATAYA